MGNAVRNDCIFVFVDIYDSSAEKLTILMVGVVRFSPSKKIFILIIVITIIHKFIIQSLKV